MSSTIQIKRRTTGSSGAPAAGLEGELALNFAAGAAKTPELWAHGGTALGWLRVNPDVTVSVGTANLTGGTPGSPTGIGAAWTGLGTKPTGSIIIAKFAGTAYVLTGAGSADGDWTALGAATSFATNAEVLAGTDTSKALNPGNLRSATANLPSGGAGPVAGDADKLVRLTAQGQVADAFIPKLTGSAADALIVKTGTATNAFLTPAALASRLVAAPDATPANDASKIALLDATGKIPAGFLPVGGLTFSGTVDLTAAYAAPTPAPKNGQFYSVSKTGTIDASWKANLANAALTTVTQGDYLVWDAAASKFHHIANAVDMTAYVPLAGTANMTGSVAWAGAAANKAGSTIIDGKGGTIDSVVIDGGAY